MLHRLFGGGVTKPSRRKKAAPTGASAFASFASRVQTTIQTWTDPFGFHYVPRVLSTSNVVVIGDVLSVKEMQIRALVNHVGATSIRIDFQTHTVEVSNVLVEPMNESFDEARIVTKRDRTVATMRAIKEDEAGGNILMEELEDSRILFTRITQLSPRAVTSLLLLQVQFTVYLHTGTVEVFTSGRSGPSCVGRERFGKEETTALEEACTTDAR